MRNDSEFSDAVWYCFVGSVGSECCCPSRFHERRCSECDNQDGGRLGQAVKRELLAAVNHHLPGYHCCGERENCFDNARCAWKLIGDIIKECREADTRRMERSTEPGRKLSDPVIA